MAGVSGSERSDAGGRAPASLSRVILTALLPSLVFSIGEGAILPIVPSVAQSLGAGLEFAGFIAGAIMIGQMLGDLPSGPLVARIGEQRAMLVGSFVAIVGVVACVLAPNAWVLLVGILVIGFAAATFNLARHAFLTKYVPLAYRARALSTLGGVFRAGFFVGPFITSAVLGLTGLAQHAFWIFIVCIAIVIVVLLVVPDVERETERRAAREVSGPNGAAGAEAASGAKADGASSGAASSDGAPSPAPTRPAGRPPRRRTSVWAVMREHAGALATLGVGAGVIAALRGVRVVLMPLWALSIGMSDAETAIVVGVAGGIDFALFFTSGWVMDRFGRGAAAVPSLCGLGVGFIALALTHDVDGAVGWFWLLAMWLGLANGLGSGILMTLGADLAPPDEPAPFLGAWRLIIDAGSASVPFAVAGLTALFSLPLAAAVFGVAGLAGAALLVVQLPRRLGPGGRPRQG